MTISSSLANALSGLTAAARMADVVASNTANAMTEGYARRELSLVAKSLGGEGAGVKVVGVSRIVNAVVLQDRRLADAAAGNSTIRADFYNRIETLMGDPESSGSLSARLADFDSALIEASSLPESDARLAAVVSAAASVADHLNMLSDDIAQIRMQADDSIEKQVDVLNASLKQVDELNAEILAERSAGHDATALMDQRQSLVDKISEIVPVRQVDRDRDQIALYTTGGAILLEGNPVEIGFSPVGVITADMTQASGALSGLTLNGKPVSSADSVVLGGGTLGALFAVRDELAPRVQSELDAFARDLIARFADPAVDPTLNSGDAGLFTDGGAAFDPLDEVGVAGRISLNALVDPSAGGDLWHLRDGLGAVAAGPVGNSTLLNALNDAMTENRAPLSGSFSGSQRSSSGFAAEMLSSISSTRQSAESTESYHSARQETLTQMSLADGVDTDFELEMLLRVEQAYAANAKVIKAIDELIQQILGL
ncbi:flagellar hook-associated protein FlgK [Paenirhodobacter sp. CAU 1674]|uniref:flagellar hook-associated protein FlgK n=1 Tax=Paenirhodobacter sp. CAU 1674 TaxID=3032596 RepID=UPI0023DCC979|nr:flagellar hook-associated protein FlgK [Paenirhodobacter sp. CAU 1674]MDF2143058.1 flagellar hook-associated protein FlgK [Paenirhodobacter sp. CAU 1674]